MKRNIKLIDSVINTLVVDDEDTAIEWAVEYEFYPDTPELDTDGNPIRLSGAVQRYEVQVSDIPNWPLDEAGQNVFVKEYMTQTTNERERVMAAAEIAKWNVLSAADKALGIEPGAAPTIPAKTTRLAELRTRALPRGVEGSVAPPEKTVKRVDFSGDFEVL